MVDSDNSERMREPDDLMLLRAIRELPAGVEPDRDLWPGIERQIALHPQRRRGIHTPGWMPYGIAASLLIATAAIVLTLLRNDPLASRAVSFDRSMNNMQAEYLRARNPLLEKFAQANRGLEPAALDDLHRNLEIMENARREIERQIRENPGDSHLVELLMKVHEQELDLLKRDYTVSTHSM